MSSLAPFLNHNPSLRHVSFLACNRGSVSINILPNALLDRPEDTLDELDLPSNHIDDIDMDELILVLGRSAKLTRLDFRCTSLARLL